MRIGRFDVWLMRDTGKPRFALYFWRALRPCLYDWEFKILSYYSFMICRRSQPGWERRAVDHFPRGPLTPGASWSWPRPRRALPTGAAPCPDCEGQYSPLGEVCLLCAGHGTVARSLREKVLAVRASRPGR
jgi:hypothetical protein